MTKREGGAVDLTNEAVVAAIGDQELDDSSVRERLPPQVASVYSYLRGKLPRQESLRLAIDCSIALGRRPCDLSLVWPRFALWLLADQAERVVQFAHADRVAVVREVIALYERLCAGTAVSRYEWEEAMAARARWNRDAEAAGMLHQAEKLLELIREASGSAVSRSAPGGADVTKQPTEVQVAVETPAGSICGTLVSASFYVLQLRIVDEQSRRTAAAACLMSRSGPSGEQLVLVPLDGNGQRAPEHYRLSSSWKAAATALPGALERT